MQFKYAKSFELDSKYYKAVILQRKGFIQYNKKPFLWFNFHWIQILFYEIMPVEAQINSELAENKN